MNRGRPEFTLHISRLADIKDRGVVPSLHKLDSQVQAQILPLRIQGHLQKTFEYLFVATSYDFVDSLGTISGYEVVVQVLA